MQDFTSCTLIIFILILHSGRFFETEENSEREQKMPSRRMGNGDVLVNQLASQKPQNIVKRAAILNLTNPLWWLLKPFSSCPTCRLAC